MANKLNRISITVKPTNNCNMRCKHCYHAEEGFDNTMMKPDYAKKMFAIAAKDYSEIFVVFHGGEPTLWGIENFTDVLEYQEKIESEKNVIFKNSIQTNGLLIDDKWIELFKKYNFSVGISFDGPHNDDLRSNTEIVYKNMCCLKEKGIKFGTLCVENGLSIEHFENTYNWFKNEGFNFKVLAMFMSGNALEHKELELDVIKYVDCLCKMYQKWLFDKECNISMQTFEDLLKVSDRLYCIQYGGSCIHNRICINPNGDIYPCGRPYTSDFILGNISSLENFSQAFNTAAYKNLERISIERQKQCRKSCKFFGVCKGGCVSSAILEGSFEKINNTTCVRAKRLLSKITEINTEIYKFYDSGADLSKLNPHAVKIIKKSREGKFNFMHQANL
ncbi:radical SAM protein [uncultured Treponema sp.]|uniref:radical SAM/SPASM domain-containing protein n=1 Tax=uncultured Treponema sp. TaxID=162155 RepID=UPI00260E5D08|nr:radical SAM protein [uncultured Treponema sp.]